MENIEYLIEAKQAFQRAYQFAGETLPSNTGLLVDLELREYLPAIEIALDALEDMSEQEHYELTNRFSINTDRMVSRGVFERYGYDESGQFDNHPYDSRVKFTLESGLKLHDLESCYRILDVATKRLTN
ncbi:hypothetical protein HQ489_00410 [Candidatus Woesearchaeota archaeon]|nr:hypothetical protein [Candidatus Woesearchaeota archaeon]